MNHYKKYFEEFEVKAEYSFFDTGTDVKECHVMLIPDGNNNNFEQQLQNIQSTLNSIWNSEILTDSIIVFKRYFLSDAANQYASLINFDKGDYALSIIQQPPLNGSKVALWIYMASGLTVEKQNDVTIAKNNNYEHLWAVQMHGEGSNPNTQTLDIFNNLSKNLTNKEINLKDNCIRTWLFVHNVDVNYGDVVNARKDFFNNLGMTPETHYISSTGIEGRNNDPNALVIADAYSISGIKQNQINFLKASSHMNPTYEYGVTFERGTSVEYGDRKHIFISGTASIDTNGEIVHTGNVVKQAERAMENINALLTEANAKYNDIAQMIVYLRDLCDYRAINKFFDENFPNIPKVLVLAPVCRPGWLIEIECIAIFACNKPEFSNY